LIHEKIFSVAQVADQAVLYLLILLSIVSVAIILERFFYLRKVGANSQKIRNKIRESLISHNLDEVESMPRDSDTIEGRAITFALRHIKDHGANGLDELYHSFALNERPELDRFLGFLATVGSNAPYIGLFGTVLGIMKAFNDLAMSAEAGQQTVMAGISSALVATAAGLFVAIPAVIAYNYFQKQVKGILLNLESLKELCLAYARRKGQS
jgi:biopolymer transport protein TolQ